MKIYRYYIVYQIIVRKDDKAKLDFASIELELYDKIRRTDPVAELIKEIRTSEIKDKDIEIGVQLFNWKLLDEYEVNDEEKETK